ncbi:hypothetical protein HY383_04480 [Candidatus Daviesbacteria bacterium]|nr:hypothetical protein [Candidatus Daviesbacteria bacterium]
MSYPEIMPNLSPEQSPMPEQKNPRETELEDQLLAMFYDLMGPKSRNKPGAMDIIRRKIHPFIAEQIRKENELKTAATATGQAALTSITEELRAPLSHFVAFAEFVHYDPKKAVKVAEEFIGDATKKSLKIVERYEEAIASGDIRPSPHAFQPGTTVLSVHPYSQAQVDKSGNPT